MRHTTTLNLLGVLAILSLSSLGLFDSGIADDVELDIPGRATPDEKIAEGTFEDRAKSVDGRAIIRESADGGLTLSFEDFDLPKTPNPHVYLSSKSTVAMGDVTKGTPIRKTLDGAMWHVGALEKTDGGQRYQLSSSVDLDRHNSIVIWCEKVNVPLAVAPLSR